MSLLRSFEFFGGGFLQISHPYGAIMLLWYDPVRDSVCRSVRAENFRMEGNQRERSRLKLLSEEPKNERQNQTNQDAGDDREVETEAVALVMDIAGQAANPAAAEPGPEDRAGGGDEEAEDDEEFAEIGHGCLQLNK